MRSDDEVNLHLKFIDGDDFDQITDEKNFALIERLGLFDGELIDFSILLPKPKY